MAIKGAHIAGGGAVAVAIVLIIGFEGRVLHVYPDPVTHGAPWTYCDGETKNPQFKHVYTDAECDKETLAEVTKVDAAVLACVAPAEPLPAKVEAAFVSLAWNIGTAGFCKSSIAAFAHDGRLIEACKRISLYDHAGGKVIPGLTFRRGEERKICLQGAYGEDD